MALDSMRGSGRPPFLLGGLIVVCIILSFNWWSLSSQNYDLVKQLEHLGKQLKICSDEQDICSHQRYLAESRVKSLDGEIAMLRVREEQGRADNEDLKKRLGVQTEEIKTITKEKQDVQNTAILCETELESLKKLDISKDGTIASLRLEKERFNTQLEERKQDIQKLRVELTQVESELKAERLNGRGELKVPATKNALDTIPRNGDLKVIAKSVVEKHSIGVKGIIPHREPILPQDPPNAVRPKPRFSVTYVNPDTLTVPAPKVENGDISVGGNHENARAQDVDKAENEENNAGERIDEANVDNEPEPQMEEAERMEEANEGVAEETPKKNVQDHIANSV